MSWTTTLQTPVYVHTNVTLPLPRNTPRYPCAAAVTAIATVPTAQTRLARVGKRGKNAPIVLLSARTARPRTSSWAIMTLPPKERVAAAHDTCRGTRLPSSRLPYRRGQKTPVAGGPAPAGPIAGGPALDGPAAPCGALRNLPFTTAVPPPCAREVNTDHDADILRQEATASDWKLIKVYGERIHQNNDRHLHDGVEYNAAVCLLYDRLVSYLHAL